MRRARARPRRRPLCPHLRSLTGVQLLILDDGASNRSTPVPGVTSTRSSRNATDAARPLDHPHEPDPRLPVDKWQPSSASRRSHDASFFERVVRRTCVLNSTICVFERLICQGIPFVIWWPDNRPF
jgi:hypothetical protein